MAIAFQPDIFQNDIFQVSDYPPSVPLEPDPITASDLTIDGSEWFYKLGTLQINEQTNGRNTLSCTVFSVTPRIITGDQSQYPEVNDEIILTVSGTRKFAGHIDSVDIGGFGREGNGGEAMEFEITAIDYNALPDRRHMSEVVPAQTVKLTLQTIVTYLAPYGITLHADQWDGPVLPAFTWDLKNITEALNELCTITGPLVGPPTATMWEIDYFKVLRVFTALDAGREAPFNLPSTTEGALIGDVTVRPDKTNYANYVIVLFGTGEHAVIDAVGTGDGILTSWALRYTGLVSHGGIVNVGGTIVAGVLTGGTDETLGLSGSGATWTWDPATNTITRSSAPTGAIHMSYMAAFPQRAVAAAGGIAVEDHIERVYRYDDIFDVDVADALAESLLLQVTTTFKEVSYVTPLPGLKPGQVQTIDLSHRNISGVHLITQVRVHDRVETELWYEVKAVSGSSTLPESWMATYQGWSRGGGGSSGGAAVVVVSGGGAQTFFLGGNALLQVQSGVPDWVAADAVRVTIDTSTRGSLTGTVQARLKAANGTVTARLRNITDGTTVGTSAVVSTPDWTDVSFAVALTPGSKTYELQVLPSLANTDVAAVGTFV